MCVNAARAFNLSLWDACTMPLMRLVLLFQAMDGGEKKCGVRKATQAEIERWL